MMKNTDQDSWRKTSADELRRALDDLLVRIEERLAGEQRAGAVPRTEPQPHSALFRLVERFGLSGFERDLLLLCAGYELDRRFGTALARAHGTEGSQRPTFSTAAALLDGAYIGSLAPGSVLRSARLIAVETGRGLASSPVTIEEAVLHELAGWPDLDERLRPVLEPALAPPENEFLPSQRRAVDSVVRIWAGTPKGERRPAVYLSGGDRSSRRQIAAAAAGAVGFGAFALDTTLLPGDAAASEELLELWQRDALLHDFALLLDLEEVAEGSRRLANRWIGRLQGLVLVSGREPSGAIARPIARVHVRVPEPTEQRALWAEALAAHQNLDGCVDDLAQQFPLSPTAVREVVAEFRGAVAEAQHKPSNLLWELARRRARGGLDTLAQRLSPVARWEDLVLAQRQKETLRTIAVNVRQRTKVHEEWGFAALSKRGLGIGALFCGPSGTGKTMAAEVLARELGLDLYRIDLSATVSKYIGETEKNLQRIFDAAERSGAILLFDEADSIFGKRSEVRDSHDRYANLEISYLLQRIETYRGLAILTTNFEKNVDPAFLRRLRFVVTFPFPSVEERREIWRRVFPAETPTRHLDVDHLAEIAVAGGNIRNIAIGAAFRAADEDRPVAMTDVLEAARAELAKHGQTLSDAQAQGWSL